jgi:hypothetical protein
MTLALNFLAVAGAVAWLHQTHRLDREKVLAIRDILFEPAESTDAPATQPSADPSTQPSLRLDELLNRSTGRTATEQVEFIQHAFDAQMTQLERRERELSDLQRQVELAKQQLTRDRQALETQRQEVDAREQGSARLAADQGFQDSLELYISMPAKQVKSVFMTLDDATVTNYLKAMEPRTAAKIVKEFKSAPELERIQSILERMRQASAEAMVKE